MNTTEPGKTPSLRAHAKQSRAAEFYASLDCFVATLLAMTMTDVFMGSGLAASRRPGMMGTGWFRRGSAP